MSDVSRQCDPHSSPLVRFLAGLSAGITTDTPPGQAQRLGDLLDFADTVRLSTTLDALPTLVCPPGAAAPAEPTAEAPASAEPSADDLAAAFTDERAAILQWTLASFAGTGGFRRVPLPEPPKRGSSPASFHAYAQFYAAQQREIQFRIDALQRETRLGVAGLSARLYRLTELDAVLDDALGARLRALFQRVPALLARRYAELSQSMQANADTKTSENGGASVHPQLCQEMQAALVAEVDVRLLPVQGLIAALTEESRTTHE